MSLLNMELWQEARRTCTQSGSSLYALARIQRHTLTYVSRLWIEEHGERLARIVSDVLNRRVEIEDLFPQWDRPDERPLSAWENNLLARAVDARSSDLTPRQREVVRATFGLQGQPVSLAQVAARSGVTRERVRQIEEAALQRLGIRLPPALHKSVVGRRRRARLLLNALNEKGRELPLSRVRAVEQASARGTRASEASRVAAL
jgi:RNA polymerase sigma factor (sigma-70 family)